MDDRCEGTAPRPRPKRNQDLLGAWPWLILPAYGVIGGSQVAAGEPGAVLATGLSSLLLWGVLAGHRLGRARRDLEEETRARRHVQDELERIQAILAEERRLVARLQQHGVVRCECGHNAGCHKTKERGGGCQEWTRTFRCACQNSEERVRELFTQDYEEKYA